ncbi:MAG: hypothetical protein IPM56_18605 [Ignavibacteriales bacterium]|nr:MAG: hypothetical protein IPM56_18605 [Ignavibacteriales bacterium]
MHIIAKEDSDPSKTGGMTALQQPAQAAAGKVRSQNAYFNPNSPFLNFPA